MHIGIDARFLGPGGKGLGRYTEKLLTNLEAIDRENRYTIFLRPENFDTYHPGNPGFTKILAPYRWYSWQEQIGFPRLLAKHRLDLMHFPHFNVPILYRRPFIVTIHDLIITHFPTVRATRLGPVMYYFKRLGYTVAIRSAVRRAKKVITVSEYVKNELHDYFHLAKESIVVTYEAADAFPENSDTPEQILRRLQIQSPFLLYVGNAYPHKNLELLLESFVELRRQHPEVKLVLVGKMDYFYTRLLALRQALKLDDAVIFPGYVADADLPALYRQAMLYVFPSLSEGFGLPPLEAMQYGAPVACSSYSCLPEILGQSAAYFDPKNKHAIVQVLSDLIQHEEKRAVLRQRGFEQVKRYSWKNMAEQTLAYYREP